MLTHGSGIFTKSERSERWTYKVAGHDQGPSINLWDSIRTDPKNDLLNSKVPKQPERSIPGSDFEIIFRSLSSCLSAANLRHMQSLEDELLNKSGFAETTCHQKTAQGCIKPMSVLRLFDGTYEHLNIIEDGLNVFRTDFAFKRIENIMSIAFQADGDSLLPALQNANQPFLRGIVDYTVDTSKSEMYQ